MAEEMPPQVECPVQVTKEVTAFQKKHHKDPEALTRWLAIAEQAGKTCVAPCSVSGCPASLVVHWNFMRSAGACERSV